MGKQKPRDFTRYVVREHRRIVHGGITTRTLEERLAEHQQEWPDATITKIGPKVTEETARDWEKDKGYS